MDGKTTKPWKKGTAELPPMRGQIKVRAVKELSETVFSMIGMLTGKTEEGKGGGGSKIYNLAAKSGGAALPVRKIKA